MILLGVCVFMFCVYFTRWVFGIDQIINNAAKMRQMSAGQFPMPMVFRGPTA